jgi:uncharacterized protein YjbJ (UPF0337 family)
MLLGVTRSFEGEEFTGEIRQDLHDIRKSIADLVLTLPSTADKVGKVMVVEAKVSREPGAKRPTHGGMNWMRVEGHWKQFAKKIQQEWGKLTDDDLTDIEKRRAEELIGKIQERYGIAKDEAETQVEHWSRAKGSRTSTRSRSS